MDGEAADEGGEDDADEDHGAASDGLEDETGDGGGEDGEELPGILLDRGGFGEGVGDQEIEDDEGAEALQESQHGGLS